MLSTYHYLSVWLANNFDNNFGHAQPCQLCHELLNDTKLSKCWIGNHKI